MNAELAAVTPNKGPQYIASLHVSALIPSHISCVLKAEVACQTLGRKTRLLFMYVADISHVRLSYMYNDAG